MPSTPLGQVSKAQSIFTRTFQLQDLRTQRYLAANIRQPRDECVFEMGGSDSFGGIVAGTQFSTGTIWHGDLFSITAWTDPLAACSFTLFISHKLTPTVFLPLLIAPILVPQYFSAFDVSHLQETNTSGGANQPDVTQELFSPLVRINELQAGDMIFCSILTATGAVPIDPLTGLPAPASLGIKMFNLQLGFKLRAS